MRKWKIEWSFESVQVLIVEVIACAGDRWFLKCTRMLETKGIERNLFEIKN